MSLSMSAPSTFLRIGGRQLARRRARVPICQPSRLTSSQSHRSLNVPAARSLSVASVPRCRLFCTSRAASHNISDPLDTFPRRHTGPTPTATEQMIGTLDPPVKDLDEFIKQVVPESVLVDKDMTIEPPRGSETSARDSIGGGVGETDMAKLLKTYTSNIDSAGVSLIGCGYHDTVVPNVIKRNVLENPAWYTSYTPYQPEISQGRLESLLNFQTVTADLTGLPIANASLLDEGTAAAEAMTMSVGCLPMSRQRKTGKVFVVSDLCHPQTIAVMKSRAQGFGIKLVVGDVMADDFRLIKDQKDDLIGVLAQYPDTEGGIADFRSLSDTIHTQGGLFSVATDLLALTLLTPPGEFGADIAFGSAQRLGVPMGFGGPHAAFFACVEKHKRKIPGRIIGLSKDRLGNRAYRLALQTREQHIRREKATSNICTSQALLANMSAMYAVYHGPDGLKAIAQRIMGLTNILREKLRLLGYQVSLKYTGAAFDTLIVETPDAAKIVKNALDADLYLRQIGPSKFGISLDETVDIATLKSLLSVLAKTAPHAASGDSLFSLDLEAVAPELPESVRRTSPFLEHAVFNSYHSETEMLRYIHHLGGKDLSLVHSMIPLGSCTMKLNATSEMVPITSPEFSKLHPFTPPEKVRGYVDLITDLQMQLANITGMAEVTIQPNSGAQGEFAGLRAIKMYQDSHGVPGKRNVCLIPVSAHGTNPASATMAGMSVVSIKCDASTGNLDLEDLKAKCEKHQDTLSAIMITYPSTFGIYEPQIKEVCEIIHNYGGQVYMDGANLNAQIGLCSPGAIGADVCHLNLHKTFCIPHGGGGPGVGPIGVAEHLRPFLPSHPLSPQLQQLREASSSPPISSAPFGSASILPITFSYINMMGSKGLTHATKMTLLNANYIFSRLKPYYPIVYANANGRCAHEFILDVRKFKATCGIEAIDIAKRLQDYGFHAPTMSWPVVNTLMIEPTESESKAELDRFCDALISIRQEIAEIEQGQQPREGNVLKYAPHTQRDLIQTKNWDRPYSREKAAYPLPSLLDRKFWPVTTRLDDAYGDQNLFCTCAPVEDTA